MIANSEAAARQAVAAAFRSEYGRIVATLVRQTRDFPLAEDAVQEAFVAALESWSSGGVPRNPGAWLTTAARRKAIDKLRRAANYARKQEELAYLVALDERMKHASGTGGPPGSGDLDEAGGAAGPSGGAIDGGTGVGDDQLRLIFTCCHPALAMDARVALTLKTLGGLTTGEIARAFLVAEPTMGQRIVRAKRKIRDANIPYRVPSDEQLAERLSGVLGVLYLIFNEGYTASTGDQLVRSDLCADAIRLGTLLVDLTKRKTAPEAEAQGLLALMMFHDARRRARMSDGRLVLLEDQDRSLWDEEQIAAATAILDDAIRMRRPGVYQIQAAIAALHCRAPHADATDWMQITLLYRQLYRMHPTPVVALNRAAAHAMADGPSVGLRMLQGLADELARYQPYHATHGELLARCDRPTEAIASYRVALDLATNEVERRFIVDRLAELEILVE